MSTVSLSEFLFFVVKLLLNESVTNTISETTNVS